VHPFFLASSGEAPLLYFLTERMRLSLSPHPQLSVIPHFELNDPDMGGVTAANALEKGEL